MDTNQLRKFIEDALVQEGHSDKNSRDVAFHMTDWLSDFEQLTKLFSTPEAMSSEEIEKLLTGFLIHVPNHLAAASKLMLDIPVSDVFGVGATTEREEDNAI